MAQVTVRESTGDYTNLKSAIDAAENDILIDQSWSAEDDQSSTILVDSNAVKIEATGDAKTGATVGSTTYRLRHTGSNHLFDTDYDLEIIGVDMCNESTGSSDEVIRINNGSVDLICNVCLMWFTSRVTDQDVVNINGASNCSVELINCVGWNVYRAVIDASNTGGTTTLKINSCHFYEIGYSTSNDSRSGVFGLAPSGTVNCYMFNSLCHINTGTVCTATPAGTNSVTIDNSITNVSDWANADFDSETITDSLLSHNWTDDDTKSSDGDWVIVKSLSTPDFSLATNTYNEAQDMHTDSTGATLTMPSVDIKGTSRPQNTNYDCGAFEIVAGGGETLLPTKGNFTLTGQAVSINASEVLNINKGAITCTGKGVNTGESITINKGLFTLTGKSITLNEIITIGNGVCTLTGKSVTLNIGEIIEVAEGVFTITGQDMYLNETVIITNASITITGQTVIIVGDGTIQSRGLSKLGGHMTMN